MNKKSFFTPRFRFAGRLFAVATLLFILVGCAQGAAPAPTTAAGGQAAPTTAPAAASPTSGQAGAGPTATTAASGAPTATGAAGGTTPAATSAAAAQPVSQVPRNQTLIMGVLGGIGPTPDLKNPFNYNTNVGDGLQQLMIESLFYLNFETGKIEPWLAESYTMGPDNKDMTIKLRQGITWNDGQPFTADDVVFTFNMLKKYSPALWHSEDINDHVDSVTKVDNLTVKLNFKGPEPRYIYGLSVEIYNSLPIVPQHIWKDQDPTKFKNFDLAKGWPVFTGPYKLVSASQSQLIYDLDPNWWGAKTGFHALPAPKRIIMVDPGPEEKAAASIEANDVDVIPQMGVGTYEAVIAKNQAVTSWSTTKPYGWLDTCPHRLAINNAAKPWDDPQMREALRLSIDPKGYADQTTEGTGLPATWLFPAYPVLNKYIDENKDLFTKYEYGTYNPDKAVQIFESKGYKKGAGGKLVDAGGKPLSVNLLMLTAQSGGTVWGLATTAITQYLEQVGITVNTRSVEDSVFEPEVRKGNYDIALFWTCGSVVDPLGTMDNYLAKWVKPIGTETSGNEANIERWNNQQYSDIVDKIANLNPDDPQIHTLFRQALDIWLQNTPAIPLAQQPWIIPFNNTYWTNWPTEKNDYIHPPVWWQTNLITIMNIKPAK